MADLGPHTLYGPWTSLGIISDHKASGKPEHLWTQNLKTVRSFDSRFQIHICLGRLQLIFMCGVNDSRSAGGRRLNHNAGTHKTTELARASWCIQISHEDQKNGELPQRHTAWVHWLLTLPHAICCPGWSEIKSLSSQWTSEHSEPDHPERSKCSRRLTQGSQHGKPDRHIQVHVEDWAAWARRLFEMKYLDSFLGVKPTLWEAVCFSVWGTL